METILHRCGLCQVLVWKEGIYCDACTKDINASSMNALKVMHADLMNDGYTEYEANLIVEEYKGDLGL